VFYSTDYEGNLIDQGDESLAVDWFPPNQLPKSLHTVPVTVDAFLRFKESGEFQLF
jgi:hypothetical protein